MLIKHGGWCSGTLKYKHPNKSWVKPDLSYFKQGSIWLPVIGTQRLSLDLPDIITDTKGWVFHSTRGWYQDVRYVSAVEISPEIRFNANFLSRLKKIRATFTSYYKSPNEGLGASFFDIYLSDETKVRFGTYDQWTSDERGQRIHKGDGGFEDQVTRNVVGERFTYTVPKGLTIIALEVHSYGRVSDDGNKLYPYTLRGMKDFEFTLEY